MSDTTEKRTALQRLIEGYVAADEVLNMVHALGTKAAHEAAQNKKMWEFGEQGQRYVQGREALPTETTIHYDIGYYLRQLMCDVALAFYWKNLPDLKRGAMKLVEEGERPVRVGFQCGIDAWTALWNIDDEEFYEIQLIETIQQDGGFTYDTSLRIFIPDELR